MFHIKSKKDYESQCKLAQENPDKFWTKIANNYFWHKKPTKISNCDLKKPEIKWFEDGETNISYNCLDRHLEKSADKIAIVWEPNNPNQEAKSITYKELHEKTCQFANFLTAKGIKKGDRVCLYMPMIIEGVVAMLACARIGAVHSVVFAGFSAKALAGRIKDCGAKMVITADLLFRGDKELKIYEIVKEATQDCDSIENIVVYQRNNNFKAENVVIWQDEVEKYPKTHKAKAFEAENPLFILYTSGSTGTPKGILHSTGGYMTYAGYSFKNVFQYKEDELFFCTADIGWITGHSYLTYGPLLNGAKILMFEGVPTYPTPARFWEIIDKHQVNIFYTAPTAIRALMQKGDKYLENANLSSLRTLGTVGEPINEEAWQWYYDKIGKRKCPISDTWWQTETGGIVISSLAGVVDSIPAHAGYPLPGIDPILIDNDGNQVEKPEEVANLCFKTPWPSMARSVWKNEEKFKNTYYSQFFGHYFAGDGAFKNKDGLFRIIGRVDDVINVSGHRLGTAEIENAINSHPNISESAVIGIPHDVKGESIATFIILKTPTENIEKEVISTIKDQIGSIAKPDHIIIAPDLPKTRSGKIMRRILKKIIAKDDDFGDISTLVNPDIVDELKKHLAK